MVRGVGIWPLFLTGLVAVAALVLALGATGWEEGYATRYDPGVMRAAATAHGLPVADCMVSLDLAELGAFVWVRSVATGRLLHCQVSDESKARDRKRHVAASLIELDAASSRLICLDYDGPWRHCPVWVLRR
jgi:hypothetical protein